MDLVSAAEAAAAAVERAQNQCGMLLARALLILRYCPCHVIHIVHFPRGQKVSSLRWAAPAWGSSIVTWSPKLILIAQVHCVCVFVWCVRE